jgi:hypothetical protein
MTSSIQQKQEQARAKTLPKNEKTKTTPRMNSAIQVEDRASSSRSKHEGESSFSLCDRLSRTRDLSQRQLPTDHDYAVSTREYQTDQSSLKTAFDCCLPCPRRTEKQPQRQKQPHRFSAVDGVTPYQGRFADDALKMCPASSHQFCASSRCTAPRSTFAPLTISCGRENSSGA